MYIHVCMHWLSATCIGGVFPVISQHKYLHSWWSLLATCNDVLCVCYVATILRPVYIWRLGTKNCGHIGGLHGWSSALGHRLWVQVPVVVLFLQSLLSSCVVGELGQDIEMADVTREEVVKWGDFKMARARPADDLTLIAETSKTWSMSLPGPANSGACLSVPLSQDPYSRRTDVQQSAIHHTTEPTPRRGGVLPLWDWPVYQCGTTSVSKTREGRQSVPDMEKESVSQSSLSIVTKICIFWTLVLSVLLYGAETWTVTQHDSHKLKSFQMYCLSDILGITLWNQVWSTVITGENKDGASGGTA